MVAIRMGCQDRNATRIGDQDLRTRKIFALTQKATEGAGHMRCWTDPMPTHTRRKFDGLDAVDLRQHMCKKIGTMSVWLLEMSGYLVIDEADVTNPLCYGSFMRSRGPQGDACLRIYPTDSKRVELERIAHDSDGYWDRVVALLDKRVLKGVKPYRRKYT